MKVPPERRVENDNGDIRGTGQISTRGGEIMYEIVVPVLFVLGIFLGYGYGYCAGRTRGKEERDGE